MDMDVTGPARPLILLAEDESLLRMCAVEMLEDAGYEVIEVCSGDEAAEALAKGQCIAGLLTDVHMPGAINGLALARITHRLYPDAVILVVSGQAVPSAADLPPGARFIGKPYECKVVLEMFDTLMKEPGQGLSPRCGGRPERGSSPQRPDPSPRRPGRPWSPR
jgi:CheY-like chemotaxis protein